MKKLISLMLVAVMLLSVLSITVFASSGTLAYTFFGKDSTKPGFAEGTLIYTAESAGTYYLYWADNNKALPKYYEIAKFTLSSGAKGTYNFSQQTAIPVGATSVIVSLASSSDTATVSSAVAKYNIPKNKLLPYSATDKNYTYAAFSDIHIDMQGGGNDIYYVNSVDHFKKALADCVDRNVDFIVTAGDDITNASGETLEWLTYQKTLADSDYVNPIYESIGNHETRYSKYSGCDPKCGLEAYINATGMGKNAEEVISGKSYFEITEPTTGDHFIFMSLEKHTDPGEHDEFSDAQINWVTNLLNKYDGDGHKIFLIQHALIRGYGAGDDNANPGYGGALALSDPETGAVFVNNTKFKNLLESHKDVMWLSGHTHLDFAENKNYSNENNSSCHMIHVPSCCNTTRLKTDSTTGKNDLDYTFYDDTSQGYFVDVYDNATVFNGANLYYNKLYPQYTYIVSGVEAQGTTEPPTQPTTATVTETVATQPTETQPEVQIVYGDTNLNGRVDILDATLIQRYLAHLVTLSDEQLLCANVTGSGTVNILDATYIQRYLAMLVNKFPVELAVSAKQTTSTAHTSATLTAAQTYDKVAEYLKRYYQYASYDAYQSMKKTFYKYKGVSSSSLSSTEKSELESALSAFDALHSRVHLQTVYFSDVTSFGEVKAYFWKEGGSTFESWPGQKATYIRTNSQSQNVYAVTVNYSKYDSIIFNGKNGQTKDITLDGKSGIDYYTTDNDSTDGKWKVESSTYERMWYEESSGSEDPLPSDNITIYFSNNLNWNSLKCYWWVGSKNNTWPGQNMTYVRNSSGGHAIYKMTVPKGASVIFTSDNGSIKTVDITNVKDGYGYYATTKNSSGTYDVTQYVYG